ncbi:MAG: sulfite exporter TauE/SafE family protein [Bacteroidia bacterium]|jgi:uncharacterized membrane protein YfcA
MEGIVVDSVVLFLLGSIGGFISGFLGVGGGIIYVPILSYFLSKLGMHGDELVKGILANSLFTIIFSGSISSYKQYKSGNFYGRNILETAVPGIVSVLLMTYLIRNGSWYSITVFNYVFATMLLVIAVRMFRRQKQITETYEVTHLQYGATGFVTGIVTALSGLGGGIIMAPVFTDIFKQDIKKASSISNGVIPILAIAVGIYNLTGEPAIQVHAWQAGYIVFPLVIPMILSAFIFAPIGVVVSHKTSERVIRIVFASFVSLVFLKTMWQIIR